jgi:hypothetical protein
MANEYAVFTVPWTVILEEGEGINTPLLGQDYPYNSGTGDGVKKWQDVTGQPSENLTPNPNQYQIEVWANTATMDAIEADATYTMVPGSWVDLDVILPDPEEP